MYIKLKKPREDQIRPHDNSGRHSSTSSSQSSATKILEQSMTQDKALADAIAQDEEWNNEELIVKTKPKPKIVDDEEEEKQGWDNNHQNKKRPKVIVMEKPEHIEMIKKQQVNVDTKVQTLTDKPVVSQIVPPEEVKLQDKIQSQEPATIVVKPVITDIKPEIIQPSVILQQTVPVIQEQKAKIEQDVQISDTNEEELQKQKDEDLRKRASDLLSKQKVEQEIKKKQEEEQKQKELVEQELKKKQDGEEESKKLKVEEYTVTDADMRTQYTKIKLLPILIIVIMKDKGMLNQLRFRKIYEEFKLLFFYSLKRIQKLLGPTNSFRLC